MIDVTIKGLKKLDRDLKAESRRQKKALNAAVKVEGFRLMRLLKAEIRKGAPGGRKFTPLSFIARKRMHRGRNTPLRRLALAVRYFVADRDPLQLEIGWTGPYVSRRWKHLAKIQQQGFTSGMTEGAREGFISTGARLGRRAKARRYHFLKKNTRRFITPARPIMEPFWDAQRRDAWDNIRNNFRRKMRGERI